MEAARVCFCDYSSQPDIRLACDQSWDTPKWGGQPDGLLEGVYMRDDDRLYTFSRQLVTCPACLTWLQGKGMWPGETVMSKWTLRRLSAQQIKALAEKHIQLYGARLAIEGPQAQYVNRDLCVKYLQVWQAVKEKAIEAENWKECFGEEEKDEIEDACRCGDYDDLLDKQRRS